LKCVKTTLVVNQADYALPDDFLKTQRLVLVLSGTYPNEDEQEIQPITLNQQGMVSNRTGTPELFYLKKNKLIITPVPDTAKTLKLFYTHRIADMVELSDTPDVPQEYQEFIAVLAGIDCMNKDGRDPTPLLEKRNYYQKQLEDDAEDRTENQPRMIVETQDGGFGQVF